MIPERILNRTISIKNPNGSNSTTSPSGDLIRDEEIVVSSIKIRIVKTKPEQAESLGIGLARKGSDNKGLCNPVDEIKNGTVKIGFIVEDENSGERWTIEDIESSPGGMIDHHNELWLNEVK